MADCALAGDVPYYRYVQTQPEMSWAFSVLENTTECTLSFIEPVYALENTNGGMAVIPSGTTAWTKAGEPKLPVFVALFEVGENIAYSIEVITGEELVKDVGYLEPVPLVTTVSIDDGVYSAIEETKADPTIYSMTSFWPEAYYSTDEAKGAGRRYLRIGMNPFQYNPSTQQLRHYPTMRFVVTFKPTGQGET